MVVKNKELQTSLILAKKRNEWNDFLRQASSVINYVFSEKFSNLKKYHYDIDSLKQECLINVWTIAKTSKLKEDGNIFSYLIGLVSFYLRDCIRKETRRSKKVNFVDYSEMT
jgi:DNA-directed RNA polymerase specialized sigma24 family protein